MQNIEIKARLREPAALRERLAAAGATRDVVLMQTDTYFESARGRLKLRQVPGADDELIFYLRPDTVDAKRSDYSVAKIGSRQAIGVLLAQALAIRVIVRKRRELWRLDNIRVHLDEVEGLGRFIEFEAEIGGARDEASCRSQAEKLMAQLRLAAGDLVAGSYADLLLATGKPDPTS